MLSYCLPIVRKSQDHAVKLRQLISLYHDELMRCFVFFIRFKASLKRS